MNTVQHRVIQHLTAKAKLLAHRDRVLGPDSQWDPLHTLMEIALGAPLTTADAQGYETYLVVNPDIELRLTAARELAGFMYPKLKAVDMTIQGGEEPLRHAIVDDIISAATRLKLTGPKPEPKEPTA